MGVEIRNGRFNPTPSLLQTELTLDNNFYLLLPNVSVCSYVFMHVCVSELDQNIKHFIYWLPSVAFRDLYSLMLILVHSTVGIWISKLACQFSIMLGDKVGAQYFLL